MSSPAFNPNMIRPSLPSNLLIVPPKKEVMNARFTIDGRNYNIQIKGDGSLNEAQKNLIIEKFKNEFKEKLSIGVSKIQVKLSDTHSTVIINNDVEKGHIKKIGTFYREIIDLFSPNHTMHEPLLPHSVGSHVNVVIQKLRGSAPNVTTQPLKSSTPVTTIPSIKHLYLIESHKFTAAFFDKLIEKVEQKKKAIQESPEAKHKRGENLGALSVKVGQLKAQKEIALNQLVGKNGIYTQTEWMKEVPLTKPETKALFLKEWSSLAEKDRQKLAEEHLNTSLYNALFIVEPDQALSAKLHKQIGQSIAKDRMKENIVSVSQDGKINFQALGLATQSDSGIKLNYDIKVRQFGEHITGSMEPRLGRSASDFDSNQKVKFYGVNLHAETVSFQPVGGGAPIDSTQLRSGSFDFKDIFSLENPQNPTQEDKIKLALPLADLKRNCVTTSLGNYTTAQLNDHILEARTHDDPQKLYNVITELESYISSYRELSGKQDNPPALPQADTILNKCKGELNKKIADAVIMRANEESITDIFTMTQKNKQGDFSQKLPSLGMILPPSVKELVLNQVEGLSNENKQNWGMISLQTPVNALGDKGIQNEIRGFASFFKKGKKLADVDASELDPVYRELKAYENAVSKSNETIGSGLYFNIPTNFIGSKSIRRLFNQGVVDQTRAAQVDRATRESTNKLYHFASSALKKAEEALDSNPSDGELERYATSLKSLIDQTFKKNDTTDVIKSRLLYGEKLKVGDISLKDIPGADAKYEILGRITILMQMLGFQTTGHCRSGNNRTAAWLAKSHQIVGAMAASSNGEIPPPEVMAGKLSSRQGLSKRRDHWSLDIFKDTFTSSSIVLQQANKGTQGTKSKVPEFGNTVLQKSLTKGAFDLAGKFNRKLFKKAHLNVMGKRRNKSI